MAMKNSGFTLVELIVVLIIVGVLAVAALPRFFDRQTFDARGFHDQTLAMLRYAQKTAVAQRRNVYVNASMANQTVCLTYVADVTCTAAAGVTEPAGKAKFSRTAPNGISLSASLFFYFDALGRPNPNAPATLGIVGDGVTRSITVEQETGYVH